MERICNTTLNIERMSIDTFIDRIKELRDDLYKKYDSVELWAINANFTFLYKRNVQVDRR